MVEAARRLVLASGSPRRRELLRSSGYEFDLEMPAIDEAERPGEDPREQVRRLALKKAQAVLGRVDSGACILAADTIVVIDDTVLGKPSDREDAARMLLRLAGRTHRVLTGYAALDSEGKRCEVDVVESHVRMRDVSPEEARAYAEGGEPLDKAGGYALQGEGGRFVEHVEGSRTNVIGLPLETVLPVLESFGVKRS